MPASTIPTKTPLGADELRHRTRRLGQRYRTVLLLVDGLRPLSEILSLAQQAGSSTSHFEELVELGLVELPVPAAPEIDVDIPLADEPAAVTSVELVVPSDAAGAGTADDQTMEPRAEVPVVLAPVVSPEVVVPEVVVPEAVVPEAVVPEVVVPEVVMPEAVAPEAVVPEPAPADVTPPAEPKAVNAPRAEPPRLEDEAWERTIRLSGPAEPRAEVPAEPISPLPPPPPRRTQRPPPPPPPPAPTVEAPADIAPARTERRRRPRDPVNLPVLADVDEGAMLQQVRDLLIDTLRLDAPLFGAITFVRVRAAQTASELIDLVWEIERHLSQARHARRELLSLQRARELLGLGNTLAADDNNPGFPDY